MTEISDALVRQAVLVILGTRDMCGNEAEAVRELAIENGLRAEWRILFMTALRQADMQWRDCQVRAGVDSKHWR